MLQYEYNLQPCLFLSAVTNANGSNGLFDNDSISVSNSYALLLRVECSYMLRPNSFTTSFLEEALYQQFLIFFQTVYSRRYKAISAMVVYLFFPLSCCWLVHSTRSSSQLNSTWLLDLLVDSPNGPDFVLLSDSIVAPDQTTVQIVYQMVAWKHIIFARPAKWSNLHVLSRVVSSLSSSSSA